jgi:immunity protein 7 of polymorphic toxin system
VRGISAASEKPTSQLAISAGRSILCAAQCVGGIDPRQLDVRDQPHEKPISGTSSVILDTLDGVGAAIERRLGNQVVSMLFAVGWVVARSSRQPFVRLEKLAENENAQLKAIDVADDEVDAADESPFDELEKHLQGYAIPDLDWHFRRHMNNARGVLLFSSSRNHRGVEPTPLRLLYWLAERGPGSFGLVYVHDDEDTKRGHDRSNAVRAWRLLSAQVSELDDPFFSPIMPTLDPNEWA